MTLIEDNKKTHLSGFLDRIMVTKGPMRHGRNATFQQLTISCLLLRLACHCSNHNLGKHGVIHVIRHNLGMVPNLV